MVLKETQARRGLTKSSIERTSLAESTSIDELLGVSNRNLEYEDSDYSYPPCTYYYPKKKSKFNRYDDDWYNPCKEDLPTSFPTVAPKSRPPSPFYSTTTDTPRPTIPIPPYAPTTEPATVSKPSLRPSSPSNEDLIVEALPIIRFPISEEEESINISARTPFNPIFDNMTEEEETPSCLQVQSGQVLHTSVNFTIYYEYELLLANREADLTTTVWPEIDRAFQQFLALNLIECDIDVETDGASTTFASPLRGISSNPIDSAGSQYPDGWRSDVHPNNSGTLASSCKNIVIDDDILNEREIFCDVVMGSITLYLSDVTNTDNIIDTSALFEEYRNDVLQSLRDDINSDSGEILHSFDESIGIYGIYFVSKPVDLKDSGVTLMITQTKENDKDLVDSAKSSTSAIAASLTVFTLFVMIAVGFFIHQKKKLLNGTDLNLKELTTPRMDDDEHGFWGPDEFYDLDIGNSNKEVDGTSSRNNSKELTKKRESTQTYDLEQPRDPDGDIPRIPSSDFATLYGLEDNDTDETFARFNYSQAGVSMELLSPETVVNTYNPSKCNSSPAFVSTLSYFEASLDDYPDDELTTREIMMPRARSPSEDSPDSYDTPVDSSVTEYADGIFKERSEPIVTSRTSPSSTTTNSALDYILSIGSSIISSAASSKNESKNNNESMGTPRATLDDSSLSRTTLGMERCLSQGKMNNKTPFDNPLLSKTRLKESSISTVETPDLKSKDNSAPMENFSPISILDWIMRTPSTSLVYHDADTSSSNEMTPNSDYEERIVKISPSPSSRSQYFMDRRKAIENRFQNYRQSLSESINNMNDSTSTSWSASREFTRSVSLYKNSDRSPQILGASPRSVTHVGAQRSCNKIVHEISLKTSNGTVGEQRKSTPSKDITTTECVQEKRRSRVPKITRVRKQYTSLNDIEAILDDDQEWRNFPEKDDEEKRVMNTFLSSRSSVQIKPAQFQADTVIL